jgi:hypothetical protein
MVPVMRKTIYNLIMLVVLPLTLLPIILGASNEMEARRKEYYFWMRRDHLRRVANDRKRKAERLQREAAERRNAELETGQPATKHGSKST